MNAFQYLEPRSVSEAVAALAEWGERARPLAGGTDLLVQMEGGRHSPEALVYLGRVPELRSISSASDGGLRIGAGATHRQVENHARVREQYPALHQGAREVGSVQIRNLATLAGNVCNAAPSADTSPALLAYDAEVEIVGPAGARRESLEAFWRGPGRTSLAPGELVTALLLPPAPPGRRSWYRKLAVRKAMDLAMVGVCVTLVPTPAGPRSVRIALGAVAPVVLRARDAEALVERDGWGAAAAAGDLAAQAASPIDDQRASAAYRREMVRGLTARALRELAA